MMLGSPESGGKFAELVVEDPGAFWVGLMASRTLMLWAAILSTASMSLGRRSLSSVAHEHASRR